jgi:hypothetical protein
MRIKRIESGSYVAETERLTRFAISRSDGWTDNMHANERGQIWSVFLLAEEPQKNEAGIKHTLEEIASVMGWADPDRFPVDWRWASNGRVRTKSYKSAKQTVEEVERKELVHADVGGYGFGMTLYDRLDNGWGDK